MSSTGSRPSCWLPGTVLCAIVAVTVTRPSALAQGPGHGGGANPCYKNISVSCAGLKANTTRACTNGANTIPCGDIILQDSDVPDVRGANPGEAGNRGPIDMPCGEPVWVELHLFECSGEGNTGNCNDLGVQWKSCTGRCVNGDGCIGPTPTP